MLSAADDECHPGDCFGSFWVGNNESLLREARSDLDVEKLYLTEYALVQGQKPHARRDFIREWSKGAAVVNWNGHGAVGQLADEALFLATDVPALTNGERLPLFLQFGERATQFDATNYTGMGERMLASTSGGAIGVVSSSSTTYVGPSFNFNRNMFRELLDPSASTPYPLGLALQAAKVRGGSSLGRFFETYMLLGDPVLALGLPRAAIAFDAGADTLVAGQRAHIEGFVHARGDSVVLASFNGTADVEVLGSADESGYTRVDPPFHIDYDLPGAPLFRGTAPVVNGRFALDFTVPAMALVRGDSLRVSPGARAALPDTVYSGFRRALRAGPKARLSVYATAATLDAKGARNDVFLKRGDGTSVSSSPPRIAFRFPNETNLVTPGAAAAIEIRDENGIAIAGDGAIRVQFDDRAALDVTAQFRCTSADTMGSVAVAVPGDLAPGSHRVTVSACDNLGNPARATFKFTVASAQTGVLTNVIAFPNPFRDRTHIFFDLDEPGEVEVSILTTSGREVWRGKHVHDAGRGVVAWPGVDSAGGRLANGTYLYRLVVRPLQPGRSVQRYNGKVVVMR